MLENVLNQDGFKQEGERLAVFGAPPAFDRPLHVGSPNAFDRERFLGRMQDILDRNWLTNDGPYVREFEARIAEYTGVKHCVAMSSGTVALEIAIRALGLSGEVILPSMTFIATAHALQWQQITPVFCDIDPDSLTLDPEKVEQMITPRTTGIIGVHLYARPSKIAALEDIAKRRGLKLLFDAAHGLGCTYRRQRIGSFGQAEVFSFHATKFVNSFEGGMVATNDDELAGKMRLMRNFGFQGLDNVIYLGTNGKMNEMSAAMGITSFEAIEEIVAVNRMNYECYRRELSDIPGTSLMKYDPGEASNYQYIVLRLDRSKAGISRDALIKILRAENVMARRYFYPGCHRMEPYRTHFPHAGRGLPVTERVCDEIVVLPTGTAVGAAEIKSICGLVRFAVCNADSITGRMEAMK